MSLRVLNFLVKVKNCNRTCIPHSEKRLHASIDAEAHAPILEKKILILKVAYSHESGNIP